MFIVPVNTAGSCTGLFPLSLVCPASCILSLYYPFSPKPNIMIRESPEAFLASLKSHAPDPKLPLDSVRKGLSAFYAGMQEETVMGSDHQIERVSIHDGLKGI